ncbi:MAG TPA: cobalamin-independent methionine synthase II family protein [Pseudonocardia sp.]|nr:cobalamin-independent methionine synthase II family protein [Pseudonocardia sp.]
MQRSTDRILTTHTGSLPRPEALTALLVKLDHGELTDADREVFPGEVRAAVNDVVARQVAAGIDVVNDGEQSKVSYSTYVTERVSGFGGTGRALVIADYLDYPEYAASLGIDPSKIMAYPACIGELSYDHPEAVATDLANLSSALESSPGATEAFMSCASPGVISCFLQNQHYPDHESYLQAIAEVMKTEYDAIHAAGYLVQLDCPDLAMGRHLQFNDLPLADWLKTIRLHIDAINTATRDIPADRLRMHLCWGNYEGPHTRDVNLSDIVDIVLSARPAGLSFEASNPRHEHEWRVWEDVKIPDGKVLIPGVIDSTNNYVEHPQLVADRITRLAKIVGRENVIASTDCGFGTAAQLINVHPQITWAKFAALTEGAQLASRSLWG